MGPQKAAAAAGVWRPCRIPGAWNGHSLPKVVAGMHAELGVEGYVASEPGSLVHPPGKVALAWERDTAAGSVLCLEVPLLGKGRGRSAGLAPSPHSCTLWHGEAGGFCRKLDSSSDRVAAQDSPPHQTLATWF